MKKPCKSAALILLFCCQYSVGQEAPEIDPVEASELVRKVGYAHRSDDREGRVLDPAVFTEISPFTADENAVKLPHDQELPE